MPDNIASPVSSGTTIATDQLAGGEHVQLIKLMDGTPDSTNRAIVDSSGRLLVALEGLAKAEDAAHASGDLGVPILGVRNSALTALTSANGDYSPVAVTSYGDTIIAGRHGATPSDSMAGSVPVASDGTARVAVVGSALYNPATSLFEQERGNVEGTALASAARTALTSSSDLINHNARGAIFYLDVSAVSGSGGLQLRVQGVNPITTIGWFLTAPPTAVTAISRFAYVIYPGASGGSAALATSCPLPRTFRVLVVHGDASSYTYSVGYSLIN